MTVAMLFALSGVISLFDFIELLRRSSSKPDATFGLVTEIAGLRLPFVAMQILPFAVLLGGMICFWRLTRSSELVVARAAGISAWEFLSAPTLCAMLLGALATAAVSPISSVMLARAETLEDASPAPLAADHLHLNGGQLWLRQSDHMLASPVRNPLQSPPRLPPQAAPETSTGVSPAASKGVAIIHALGVRLQGMTLTAHDVSVFRLDDNDHLLARVEASQATRSARGRGRWAMPR